MLTNLLFGAALLFGPSQDELAIRQLCDRISKLTSAKNFKELKSTTTPDFKQTNMQKQTVNRDQLMASFQRTFSQFQSMKTSYKIHNLKVNGTNAVGTITWTINAKVTARGESHTVTLTDTETDTFRKVNGKWLESKVVELNGKALLDGKEIPSSATG